MTRRCEQSPAAGFGFTGSMARNTILSDQVILKPESRKNNINSVQSLIWNMPWELRKKRVKAIFSFKLSNSSKRANRDHQIQ